MTPSTALSCIAVQTGNHTTHEVVYVGIALLTNTAQVAVTRIEFNETCWRADFPKGNKYSFRS